MPKPIIRFVSGVPDIVGTTMIGAIIRHRTTGSRMYIDRVTDLKFNDKGQLIRIETATAIYVQVPNE